LKSRSAGPRSRTSLCGERSRPIHGALTRLHGISKNQTEARGRRCGRRELWCSFCSVFSTLCSLHGISKNQTRALSSVLLIHNYPAARSFPYLIVGKQQVARRAILL
jgi:hypothetical protein